MKEMSFLDFVAVREGKNCRLIDVREEYEFEAVHVKGAELFPLSKLQAGGLPAEDDREVFLICRSGGRSAVAAQILEHCGGYGETTNISDGTNGAQRAGDEHVIYGE